MGVYAGPDVSEGGLVLYLDAVNAKSYPGSGTTWTDIIGGKNGTLTNGPLYYNGNISFDGLNDYVASVSNVVLGGSFSISLWVKHVNTNITQERYITLGSDRIIIQEDANANLNLYVSDGTQNNLWIWGGGNTLNNVGNLGTNSTVNKSTPVTTFAGGTNWKKVSASNLHITAIKTNSTFINDVSVSVATSTTNYTNIVATSNGTTLNLYKDNSLVTTSTLNGTLSSTALSYTISDAFDTFKGKLASVQVYNKELSSAELTQNYNALKQRFISRRIDDIITDGLTLYLDAGNSESYPGSGSTWYDLSGNSINGTLSNGAAYSTDGNGSIVFDPADYQIATYSTKVSLGTPALLNQVQVPLTICGWAKVNDITDVRDSSQSMNTLFSSYSIGFNGQLYSLLRLDNGVIKYYTTDSTGGYQGNGTIGVSISVWNFYAITVSGTLSSPTLSIYLNDTNSETFSLTSLYSTPYASNEFMIGSDAYLGANEVWDGNIAQILWYNRALTQTEILRNFNATRARYNV